jgi:hypothetical protein
VRVVHEHLLDYPEIRYFQLLFGRQRVPFRLMLDSLASLDTPAHARSCPSPIFVAGTGRSGTSQLADIHRIPIEPGSLSIRVACATWRMHSRFDTTRTSETTPSAG